MEGILKFILLFYFLTIFYKSTTHCYDKLLTPELTLPEGKIRGVFQKNYFNETTLAFLGVPYGNPPVEELRFKVSTPSKNFYNNLIVETVREIVCARECISSRGHCHKSEVGDLSKYSFKQVLGKAPEPVRPWKGILDATREKCPCINRDLYYENSNEVVGEENCLTLNVFTKQESRGNLKPVMVFIYGGAFIQNTITENIFDPAFLLIEDVVIVVVNYRLGLLGFLSLDDSSLGVPGNAGLKDQILALKWVQKNIERFGGDPKRVTLCGGGGGAPAVHYHILSPASRGLFERAIVLSGSALCPWAIGTSNADTVAKALGVPNASEREVLNILRNMTGYEIFSIQDKIFDPIIYGTLRPFVPVIEKPNPDAVITKQPIDIIRSGDYNRVPVFFGYASNEGLIFDYIKDTEPRITEGYNYTVAIPWYMRADERQRRSIVEILKRAYSPLDNPLVTDLLVMDSIILAPVAATGVNHFRAAPNVPLYAFRVNVETRRNFFKVTKQLQNLPGTANADSIGFLWDVRGLPRVIPRTLEDLTVYRFVKLWTNFAIYGNPTPNKDLGVILPRIDNDQTFNVLEIGEELKVLEDLPERERIEVWREIYKQSPVTANFL